MENVTDQELLKRLPNDPEALDEFYRRHVRKVTGFAARRTSDPHDVADLVADVFIEVVRSSGSFDPRRGEVVSWLLGITARQSASGHRRRGRDRRAHQRLSGQSLIDGDDFERLEQQLDAARLAPRIAAILNELSPIDRETFILIAVEKLPLSVAAEALGTTPTAARMRLSRVRKRIRARLPHQNEPEDEPDFYLSRHMSPEGGTP
jgi:RNA polymerase sigma-70 factor (ECF subfamily)